MSRTVHPPRLMATLLFVAALLTGCQSAPPIAPATSQSPPSSETRQVLAPTGALRIAVYPGSPTSLVRRPGSEEMRGVTVDIGREMGSRLGVPARIVEFERVQQVVDALQTGQADMTITNATAARAKLVDFTEPLVALELGYLVPAGSALATMAEVDQPGIRVGVSQGSSSQAVLGRSFQHATLVAAPSLDAAAEMLRDRRVEAFATNKGILFQLADSVPGARVLDGRWGTESLAIAVPQGRERGRTWLEQFAASARDQGLVVRAAERAGLRGLAAPESR